MTITDGKNGSVRNILNIAHRGFTKIFPDNTLEAFEAAIEIGVDGIEFDVQETSDQNFIIFHDSELRGTNINKLSLHQIGNLKVKGKFKIPTLEETLDRYGTRTKLLVDLEHVYSLERLISLLGSEAYLSNIIIASFNKDLLVYLSHLHHNIRRAFITGIPIPKPIKIMESAQADIIIVGFPFATRKLIDEIHTFNRFVYTRGSGVPKYISSLISMGIDGIISDFPNLVQKELDKGSDKPKNG